MVGLHNDVGQRLGEQVPGPGDFEAGVRGVVGLFGKTRISGRVAAGAVDFDGRGVRIGSAFQANVQKPVLPSEALRWAGTRLGFVGSEELEFLQEAPRLW